MAGHNLQTQLAKQKRWDAVFVNTKAAAVFVLLSLGAIWSP